MADELKFCPRCAGALEQRAVQYRDQTHPVCTACGFVLWQNRKASVEALIVRGEGAATEMLLGRLADGVVKGRWDMPGGFLNADDHLHDALVRECKREMDVEVRVGDIIGAFDEDAFYGIPLVTIVYECTIASGAPRPADLIDEVRWFALADPRPLLALPAVEAAVAALRRKHGL